MKKYQVLAKGENWVSFDTEAEAQSFIEKEERISSINSPLTIVERGRNENDEKLDFLKEASKMYVEKSGELVHIETGEILKN
jgi:hypothetical protein